MNEEILKLFEGMELSDEFKAGVVKIIEEHIAEEKQKIEEATEAKYEKLSSEYGEYVVSEMEEQVDAYITSEVVPVVEKYINYATEEFIKENKIAIESNTKVSLAEQFLGSFKTIAEQYNVTVPEGQDNVVEDLQKQLKESQARIDKLLDEKQELKESLNAEKRKDLVEATSKDMTETQKEKFGKLAEGVKFINDEQYKDALVDLRESFLPSSKEKESDKQLNEDKDKETTTVTDTWLQGVLSRV